MNTKSPQNKGYSIADLCRLCDSDRKTVEKAVTPLQAVFVKGRQKFYDLAQVQSAMAIRKGDKGLKDQKLEQEIRRLRIANDQKERKLIPVDVIARRFAEVAQGQKDLLRQRLENEAPSQLADQKPEPIRIMLKRVVDEICQGMQLLVKE